MGNLIVTTTVNNSTPAMKKFDSMPEWDLLVIADRLTPANYKLNRGRVLFPADYVDEYYPLVNLIGWDSVRLGRMIGFIEAWKSGAEIIASIDDDCMPDDDWGKDVVLGQPMSVQVYEEPNGLVMDPLYYVNLNEYIWARGFPVDLLNSRVDQQGKSGIITPLVRVDFCRGEGDIDASCRIVPPEAILYNSEDFFPFSPAKFSPINTQNTFIHRSALKDFYANIPFIGRADDIWAGYIFQALHPNSTVYCKPSATHVQNRSVQSVVHDLEDEIFMYKYTYSFLRNLDTLKPSTDQQVDWILRSFSNQKAVEAVQLYRSYFK